MVALSIVYYLAIFLPKQSGDLLYQQANISQQTSSEQQTNDDLTRSFVCPEDYQSPQAREDALITFIDDYSEEHPNATLQDIYTYRHTTLVSHSCNKTLANLLQNISPDDLKLYFVGKDFGPQNLQFTNDTNVWSSYYTLGEQGLANPDEEIILNFYLHDVWTSKKFTAQSVAQNIADSFSQYSNSTLINKFTAPDDITKKPAYFIISDTIHPDQNYAYVYIMKISSIENDVFSVAYSKKFNDDASNLQSNINNWLTQDLGSSEGASSGIANIGVNANWLDYFANKSRSAETAKQEELETQRKKQQIQDLEEKVGSYRQMIELNQNKAETLANQIYLIDEQLNNPDLSEQERDDFSQQKNDLLKQTREEEEKYLQLLERVNKQKDELLNDINAIGSEVNL